MLLGEIQRWNKTKEVKSYYDRKSKSYDETFDMLYFRIYDAITWKYIEPYVPMGANALALDAGGGTGRWAIQIAKKGCRVTLLDVSKQMLGTAAEKVAKDELLHKVRIEEGDITKTDYADETFDMILCEHTLFLFENPDIAIRELKRILKRKARLIVSVHNRYVQSLVSLPEKPSQDNVEDALSIVLRKKYGNLDENGKVKIYTWTPEEFRTILERNGLQVEKIVGKGITMPLRISKELFMKRDYPKDLFKKILQFELALCEKTDALALAGHLQAIAHKV
jgi:ubiquinone/menaquinone biosynthesis C-methylase UbiE